jgi:hypothetical protein
MQAYAIFGHGCDIIDPATGISDERIVPPGCIYVTVALCGWISWDSAKLMYAFQDPYIERAIRDPVNHIDELNAYFETNLHDETYINIHMPGDTYNNNSVKLILDINDAASVAKSGIYSFGHLPSLVDSLKFPERFVMNRGKNQFTQEDVRAIYNGSIVQPVDVLPTHVNIQEFVNRHADQMTITMDALFAKSPGIFYNFACRPACDSRVQAFTRLRRAKSNPLLPGPNAPNIASQIRGKPLIDLNEWVKRKIRDHNRIYARTMIRHREEPRIQNLPEKMNIELNNWTLGGNRTVRKYSTRRVRVKKSRKSLRKNKSRKE